MLGCTFIGYLEYLQKKLTHFISESGIDELMVSSNIYDREAKLKSFSILQEAMEV